jgi:hypothetical protein
MGNLSPHPDLLSQNMHFNKLPREFMEGPCLCFLQGPRKSGNNGDELVAWRSLGVLGGSAEIMEMCLCFE